MIDEWSDTDIDADTVLKEPKMYKVILHNDHYTTMDFVVDVLMSIFHKPAAQATKIMLDVHRKGQGICGVYTYDIAATRVNQVHQRAKQRQFPLKCSLEEA
ncbi:MAG: ATP-dependent Clp protease adapter ClpS [Deltaproteobacteria bacterium]|nr:ATP-dependent Clp protease adapter ClpS [Deltaproteobacteria bacterium]